MTANRGIEPEWPRHLRRSMDKDEFCGRYDDIIRHPRMRALYGNSRYFNVGYWVDGIRDQVRACDRLVDELAVTVPPGARLILDVGCGRGAATLRLERRFAAARVVGCNISRWQLEEAKRLGVAELVEADALDLPFENASADALLAIESAQHFDTRTAFFDEARRVLRPGGTIVLADMLFSDPEPIGSWMLPPGNAVSNPAVYAELLRSAGFEEVSVRDVTDFTWVPHCAAMRAAAPDHAAQVDVFERSLAHYVFARGRKS